MRCGRDGMFRSVTVRRRPSRIINARIQYRIYCIVENRKYFVNGTRKKKEKKNNLNNI